MDTFGNFSEYLSMANDYTTCAESDSLYYSINESDRKSPEDSIQDANITLNDFDATKIENTTLQHENITSNELEVNRNDKFLSSTPNNKTTDGFLEVSKVLRQISTKIQAIQNKENITTNKAGNIKIVQSKKLPITKNVISPKPTLLNNKVELKKSTQVVPSISNLKKVPMRIGSTYKPLHLRKSLIPSKLETKDSVNELPNKQSNKESTRKENNHILLRKSIIPKSTSNKPITSALKVSIKPRSSILPSQNSLKIRRSIEKLNVANNSKGTNHKLSKPISSTIHNRKTLNIRQSIAKLSIQKSVSPESNPPNTSTSNKWNTLNPRRSTSIQSQRTIDKQQVFECTKCKRKFHVESNYLTHINSHIDNKKFELACKFCDKKFQLASTLHTHFRDYCTKIPSKDKRLLTLNTKTKITQSSKNNSNTNSMDSLSKISNCSTNSLPDSSSMKPPGLPSVLLYKETHRNLKTLHSGVSRTPKKINMCKKCGKMFYSIFTLQAHKTCAESDDDETDGNVQN